MRIIHVISGGDVGGAKTHVLSLVKGLMKNHEVLLTCFMEGAFSQEAVEMGIPTEVFANMGFSAAYRQLRTRIREGKFDLVHCHGSRANLMGWLLKRSVRIPVITTVHSDPKLDYLGRPAKNLTYGTANRLALRRLDGWVCVSDLLRETLNGSGFDPHYTFTIVNGVDFSSPYQGLSREEFWRSVNFDVKPDHVVFGIAARLTPVKDISTLIRAFSKAVAKQPNIRLAIAGDGEQKEELMALATNICPKNSVHFLGWTTDTDSFYHAIDVNMLTSVSEGLPYAIPEGARMRKTTIATNVGAVPQIVVDGVTGFLAEPGDVDKLAERMIQVAGDRDLREKLGDSIYARTKEKFSSETTVRLQTEIYEQVLTRKAREAKGRDGVLICGAYGKGNAGDETILEAILQQLRGHDADMPICVMSRLPKLTARRNGVRSIFTFNVWKAIKEMKRSKLFISGGGSLIQDATSTRSLLFYLYSILRAKKYGCSVMMYGCGIGPVRRERNRKLAARIIDSSVDVISLRDPESKRELERMGVTHPMVRVTADPALLQTISEEKESAYARFLAENGMDRAGKYCLFCLRPWGSVNQKLEVFAHAAEYAHKRYGLTPVFFQLEPGKDGEITQSVANLVKCPKIVLPTIADYSLIGALMRDMQLVVSMRLHALIFAAGQGTPLVGVSYDPKVKGFMDYMGQKNCVELQAVTEEDLLRLVDNALTSGDETKEILKSLRVLAAQNDALAWKLINDEPLT